MPVIHDLLQCVNDFKESTNVLSKCSVFNKYHSRGKQCDLSSFYNVDIAEEDLKYELDCLLEEGKTKAWNILISSYQLDKNRISLKLLRTSVIKSIFLEVSECQSAYGSTRSFSDKTYNISCSECEGITRLRMTIASRVLAGVITLSGGVVNNTQKDGTTTIHFGNGGQGIVVCPVKMSNASDLSETDYIRLRTEDMLAMGDHKELSERSVQHLVDASIVFDLMSVKLEKPIILDMSEEPKPARNYNCKGAPFVFYNYARLCAILKRFDQCVSKGIYSPLPSLHDINYGLLTDEDEWSLVFDLVGQWPSIVLECQDLSQPRLHLITGFLSRLASLFSVYYRHARVLNEGLTHQLPLMQARIHLLLAIKQVFQVAFSILGITAPTTM